MARRIYTSKPKRRFLAPFITLLLLAAAGCAAYGALVLFEQEGPVITLGPTPTVMGREAVLELTVHDQGLGLQEVQVNITQKDKSRQICRTAYPRAGYTGQAGPLEHQRTIALIPEQLKLKDGPATINVTARDYSFKNLLKGNRSSVSREIVIDTTPPKIELISSSRHLKPGSSGLVIYKVSDDAVSHGVMIDEVFHPGFPAPGGRKQTQNALVALPHNATEINNVTIAARDQAGNTVSKPFGINYQPVADNHDQIKLSDGFFKRKIPEFEQHYPEMSGSLVEMYLYTNRNVRQNNNQIIHDLCQDPHPQRLWSGRFLRMKGATRAKFADRRSYVYQGQVIDQQTHLGTDLASTRRANIKAAGKGKVIYTDYLGIYGKMVILDHGQGLFSLYSHMSRITVQPGQIMDRGEVIGQTGTSGMAGGDHLHFSMLVNGIFVNPLEWWDQRWIDLTIDEPLVDAKF